MTSTCLTTAFSEPNRTIMLMSYPINFAFLNLIVVNKVQRNLMRTVFSKTLIYLLLASMRGRPFPNQLAPVELEVRGFATRKDIIENLEH